MVEDKTAADTFLMQTRDNTFWADERSRDRHNEMIHLLNSIRSLLITNVVIGGLGLLAAVFARH